MNKVHESQDEVFDSPFHMELLCKDFTVQNGKNIHDIGGKLFTKSIVSIPNKTYFMYWRSIVPLPAQNTFYYVQSK